MKFTRLLCGVMAICVSLEAWSARLVSPLPGDIVIDQRLNYDKYQDYVIPCIEWLQQSPLGYEMAERRRIDNFVMYWLQKNTDVVVHIPDYLVKFQSINNEFYFLYNGGWIKYALQTKDTNKLNYHLAGINSMLDYYSSGMGVKQHPYIDHLVALRNGDKLRQLYDTGADAKNTLVFLDHPANKTVYEADENHFNFRFTTINLLDPKSLNCRYKLEGYHEDWVPTNDEFVIFPKLPPGKYKFRVQASVLPGFANAVEQQYAFAILAPFWKQRWFIIAAAASLTALLYLGVRQRERHVKKVALLQQQRMMFEYDHLRSQVNPHFLFNSLNTLTGLIEEEPQKALIYSSHLADLYRNILAYRSEDQLYLFEELDILDNYIQVQKSRFGSALQVKINVPDDVRNEKKVVPLALQLLVENAMKHNVVSASQPLIVSITADHNYITIANNIQLKLSKEKSLGIGLQNITQRYALTTKRRIFYGAEGESYVVRLPLL